MIIQKNLAHGLLCLFAVAGAGCSTLAAAGLGGSSSEKKKEPTPAAVQTDSKWDYGQWNSRFGTIKFTPAGEHAYSGEYPGGSLDCSGRLRDLACSWRDNTGSGKTRFHWDDDGNVTGTFGNGESDSDQGEWNLSWSYPSAAGSGGSDGGDDSGGSGPSSKDVVLSNECSQSVDVCILSGGSTKRDTISANRSSHVTIDVGGTVTTRNGSTCGNVIAEIGASTDKVLLCK